MKHKKATLESGFFMLVGGGGGIIDALLCYSILLDISLRLHLS